MYYTDKNIPLMVHTLLKIYEESQDAGIHTFCDLRFAQSHARDLGQADLYLRRFIARNSEHRHYFDSPSTIVSNEVNAINWNHLHDLDQAWQILYVVFSQLVQQISNTSRLDLQYVSPKLNKLFNLHIAIPGRCR